MHQINKQIFKTPSGTVRGMAQLEVGLKGKTETVIKATLLTDKTPDISIKLPSRLTPSDLRALGAGVLAFADKLDELDALRTAV
ncbi:MULTISPECIES: hypothetical protein [unclassified Variovorax]|uniref:hypothetical protein n=1 Tax=unclassified Variovorax TaxID=663243 RepID=UPI001316BAD0|nr:MULTISPECIES: hypothetical protein [unclassified Variovorax]VTU41798.1 hypothetical protein H6P1_00048 [Variovorax sp. PBL-H6]VTU44526.1 hypothetical protein SRS16P1_00854 [Variovorax sp. SRS16]VTU44569.1 hypothetical protein E5P1_00846 [Variovorax sp. PBL-E5]